MLISGASVWEFNEDIETLISSGVVALVGREVHVAVPVLVPVLVPALPVLVPALPVLVPALPVFPALLASLLVAEVAGGVSQAVDSSLVSSLTTDLIVNIALDLLALPSESRLLQGVAALLWLL